jgi:hypothetical protein
MSDDRQSPDNTGSDQGPPDSTMPSMDTDVPKKQSAMPKIAFDDGALKVMEDEFQVKTFLA